MNWIPIFISGLALAVAICSFYLGYQFRKKDFQVAILKEQISAYNELIKTLFQLNQSINETYSKTISAEQAINDEKYWEQIPLIQQFMFAGFTPYTESFNKYQSMIHLLPEDVIDATMNYYNYFANLFEKENDHELGVKLLTELNQQVYEVINVIRQHIGIDDISEANMKILSAGKQQLKFVEEKK